MFTSAILNIPHGYVDWICGLGISGVVDMIHLRISGFDSDHCSLSCLTFETGFVNIVGG